MSVLDWSAEARRLHLRAIDDGVVDLPPTAELPKRIALPLLSDEMQLWRRPASTLAFPVHPVGARKLYAGAAAVLVERGAVANLDERAANAMLEAAWRMSAELYRPGVDIRSALDTFLDARSPRVPSEDAGNPGVTRPIYLAQWAVVRAACAWAAAGGTES